MWKERESFQSIKLDLQGEERLGRGLSLLEVKRSPNLAQVESYKGFWSKEIQVRGVVTMFNFNCESVSCMVVCFVL